MWGLQAWWINTGFKKHFTFHNIRVSEKKSYLKGAFLEPTRSRCKTNILKENGSRRTLILQMLSETHASQQSTCSNKTNILKLLMHGYIEGSTRTYAQEQNTCWLSVMYWSPSCLLHERLYTLAWTSLRKHVKEKNCYLAGAFLDTWDPMEGRSRSTVLRECVSRRSCSAPTVLMGLHL